MLGEELYCFSCSHVEILPSSCYRSHEYSHPHINSLYYSVSKDCDSQWQLNICIIKLRFGTHELIDTLSSFSQELCTSSDEFIPRILLFICDYPAVADYIGISLITSYPAVISCCSFLHLFFYFIFFSWYYLDFDLHVCVCVYNQHASQWRQCVLSSFLCHWEISLGLSFSLSFYCYWVNFLKTFLKESDNMSKTLPHGLLACPK